MLVFIVLASGPAFSVTNTLFRPICFQTFYGSGGPTVAGLVLHAIVMVLIIRLAIENTNL